MKKCIFILLTLVCWTLGLDAQELNCSVKINTQKLQTTDPQVFATLEQTITEFLNSTKWTNDYYEADERIQCNCLLVIQEEISETRFKADLTIQATRPVYGSDYGTALINHLDRNVVFNYEQFQPLIFSRNTYNDNLSAVLSFYAFIILGMDYDSFAPLGGEPYLQVAQEIVNTIPEAAAQANGGWRSLGSNQQNRFWLIENLLSPRVRPYRQAMYNYHRQGLDLMHKDPNAGRAIMLQALEDIGGVNQAYPNSMIVQVFTNTKRSEIIEVFKGAPRAEQNKTIQTMVNMDATNASAYREIR